MSCSVHPIGHRFSRKLIAFTFPLAVAVPLGATPLSFEQALSLSTQGAPTLASAQAKVDAARASTAPAGELPDPKLAVGVENLPIGGPDRYSLTGDFMTMQRIAYMQDIPNRSKREARVAVALAKVQQAESAQQLSMLSVRRETAVAWIRRYALEQQIALFEGLFKQNKLLESAVQVQLAGGRGSITDVLMPRQEAAMLSERLDELQAQRAQAIAALQRWIGTTASEALEGTPPNWPLDREVLSQRIQGHPDVNLLSSTSLLLNAELQEAQASKNPDWGVELAYQRRGEQFGDMVSVKFTFDLPTAPAKRQDPLIAAKQLERLGLDAELELLRREHLQEINTQWAELERLNLAVERNQTVLQPLMRDKVTLTLSAYQAGKGTLVEHLAARRESLETQLRWIALQGERQAISARLHFSNDYSQTRGAQ
jgi:cobalt-zinc-cadmium efflux system outer membrane protein